MGIGERDGFKYQVAGALPGEEVEIRVVSEKSGVRIGEMLRVVHPSPSRVDPLCPYYNDCGGCDLQHIAYREQLKFKRQWLEEIFGAFPDVQIAEVVPSSQEWGYRNRVTLHRDGVAIGFHKRKSNAVVPITKCLIASEDVNNRIATILQEPPADALEIDVRESAGSSFVQVNSGQNQNLIDRVRELCQGRKSRRLLELYSGAGNLTFHLHKLFREIMAIEGDAAAVKAGETRRVTEKIKNIKFHHSAVFNFVHREIEENNRFDAILCDPPREGLRETASLLPKLHPEKIIYVSCDPKSLARDAAVLTRKNYRLHKIIPLDMFPQTRHVECIAEMVRLV